MFLKVDTVVVDVLFARREMTWAGDEVGFDFFNANFNPVWPNDGMLKIKYGDYLRSLRTSTVSRTANQSIKSIIMYLIHLVSIFSEVPLMVSLD